MRQGLFIVLALWVFSISRGWGEQGTREQGMLEENTFLLHRRSLPLSRILDAKSSHAKQWKTEGHLTLDVAKRDHKWSFPQVIHMVHVLPWSHGQTLHVNLHVKHLEQSLSHDNLWDAVRRRSLLDVVDETTADKQANAVRRQGIDSALLRYAGLRLSSDTQTGAVYDVGLPPSLKGIQAQVTRIIPANLKQGVTLNEFTLPLSASFIPTSDYVALVYRKISSFTVYTLPLEYQYGGPVVGIISSSSNSTSVDSSLPPGSVSLPANTYINISLPMFSTSLDSDRLCAFFASNGSIFVSSLASLPNFCLSSTLGDFALLVKASSTTSPAQTASPPIATTSPTDGVRSSSSASPSAKSSKNWKLIVGALFLTLAGMAFLTAIALISIKMAERVKLFLTTRHYTRNDEALQDSLVGGSIAPSAAVMRTKPALEIDVAHFSQ